MTKKVCPPETNPAGQTAERRTRVTPEPTAPYQLLPPLSGDEYTALKADIAEHGIRVPVDVDENGALLDGHHRAAIAAELGIDCPTRVVPGLSEEDKRHHAVAVNAHRRMLTREQRRDLVAAELQRDPSRSDRAIGRITGVDHKTVGAMRRGGWGIPQPDRPRMTRDEAEQVTHRLRRDLCLMADGYLDVGTRGTPEAKLYVLQAIAENVGRWTAQWQPPDAEIGQALRELFKDDPTDMVMHPEAYDRPAIRRTMLTGCYPGCADPCPYVGGAA
jgi:hypothetical protein